MKGMEGTDKAGGFGFRREVYLLSPSGKEGKLGERCVWESLQVLEAGGSLFCSELPPTISFLLKSSGVLGRFLFFLNSNVHHFFVVRIFVMSFWL